MKSFFKTVFIFVCFVISLCCIGSQSEISNIGAINYIQNDYTKVVMVSQSANSEISAYSDRTNYTLNKTPNASNNWDFLNNHSNKTPQSCAVNIHKLSNLLENEISIRAP